MEIGPTLVLSWVMIFNSIEFSLQGDSFPRRDKLPARRRSGSSSNKSLELIPQGESFSQLDELSTRRRNVNSSSQLSRPAKQPMFDLNTQPSSPLHDEPAPVIPSTRDSDSSVRSTPPPARLRSRSPSSSSYHSASLPATKPSSSGSRSLVPPSRLPSADGNGYGLEDLEFLRFTPHMNLQLTLKLRRYTFPADTRIKWRMRQDPLKPIPKQEQIVLSTSHGDALAILDSHYTFLGMYIQTKFGKARAKINVGSGMVTPLTKEELRDVPVGINRLITKDFTIKRLNRE